MFYACKQHISVGMVNEGVETNGMNSSSLIFIQEDSVISMASSIFSACIFIEICSEKDF